MTKMEYIRDCNTTKNIILTTGKVALLTRLELIKHVGQDRVGVDEVHVVLVELADLLDGLLVVRVDEEQVPGKEEVHHVGPITRGVHGDPGVALLLDLADRVEVELGVERQHEAVVHVGHHVLHRLLLQDESSRHNVDLLPLQSVVLLGHLE